MWPAMRKEPSAKDGEIKHKNVQLAFYKCRVYNNNLV